MNAQEFIAKIAPWAMQVEKTSGVPASLTIAQAIEESSYGDSELTKKANALFGHKGVGTAGSVIMKTREENSSGGSYYVDASFRAYNSWEESVQGHGTFLSTDRYAKVRNTDGYTAAKEVAAAGYATNSKYADNLIGLMKQYNLTQYDSKKPSGATTVSTPFPGWNPAGPNDSIIGGSNLLDALNPLGSIDWMRIMWALVGVLILAAGLFIAFGASNPVMQMVQGVAKSAGQTAKSATKAKGKADD